MGACHGTANSVQAQIVCKRMCSVSEKRDAERQEPQTQVLAPSFSCPSFFTSLSVCICISGALRGPCGECRESGITLSTYRPFAPSSSRLVSFSSPPTAYHERMVVDAGAIQYGMRVVRYVFLRINRMINEEGEDNVETRT